MPATPGGAEPGALEALLDRLGSGRLLDTAHPAPYRRIPEARAGNAPGLRSLWP